jgi:broad specificity phosphatase PhoE
VRLILVCQAEPAAGFEDGNSVPASGLSERGRHQARLTGREIAAQALRGVPVAAVYSGGHAAMAETAAEIARAIALDVRSHEALYSRSQQQLPEHELLSWQEQAWQSIELLRQEHEQDAAIVAVTHELMLRLLVARAVAVPLAGMDRFRIEPASLSSIDFRQQRPLLLSSLNGTCHLEALR